MRKLIRTAATSIKVSSPSSAAVIAAAFLIAATLASAQSYSEIKLELQLDAVSRDGAAWTRDRILHIDNRYDDDWITIAWDRTKFSFAMENRGGAPLDVLWDGARLAVDGAAAQRLVHGGIYFTDRNKPQGTSRLQAWQNHCDALLPTAIQWYDKRKTTVISSSPFNPFILGGNSMPGWWSSPLIPVIVAGDERSTVAGAALHTFEVALPLRRGKITRRYRFRFVPSNVTATAVTRERYQQYADSIAELRQSSEPAESELDAFWVGQPPPTFDYECNPHRAEDRRVAATVGSGEWVSTVRVAFDRAPRRDYLVAYDQAAYEESSLLIIDVRGKPRVVYGFAGTRGYRSVAVHDVNHDGWPEIITEDHGRYRYFALWRWTGRKIESMVRPHDQPFDFGGNPQFQDVDHDGVDEIVEPPGGPPFYAPLWPSSPWSIHKLRGSHYEPWRKPDFLTTLATWAEQQDFAAHDLGPRRMMTIENDDYDDSPAPDATVELNGRVIARPRDFAGKQRILRFPVTLQSYNIVCAAGRDPVRLTVTIEPAQSPIKPLRMP